jgi:Domain of unknown function DUF29
MSTLYREDFYSWSLAQAAGLRRLAELRLNDVPELDWRELAEEIEDLSRSLERELHSRYVVLLLHLLKWQFQPGYRCGSWQASITNQRRAIARLLKKNPGLKAKIADEFTDAYAPARLRATSETGFAPATFPERCPYARRQAEDEAFWPGGEPGP